MKKAPPEYVTAPDPTEPGDYLAFTYDEAKPRFVRVYRDDGVLVWDGRYGQPCSLNHNKIEWVTALPVSEAAAGGERIPTEQGPEGGDAASARAPVARGASVSDDHPRAATEPAEQREPPPFGYELTIYACGLRSTWWSVSGPGLDAARSAYAYPSYGVALAFAKAHAAAARQDDSTAVPEHFETAWAELPAEYHLYVSHGMYYARATVDERPMRREDAIAACIAHRNRVLASAQVRDAATPETATVPPDPPLPRSEIPDGIFIDPCTFGWCAVVAGSIGSWNTAIVAARRLLGLTEPAFPLNDAPLADLGLTASIVETGSADRWLRDVMETNPVSVVPEVPKGYVVSEAPAGKWRAGYHGRMVCKDASSRAIAVGCCRADARARARESVPDSLVQALLDRARENESSCAALRDDGHSGDTTYEFFRGRARGFREAAQIAGLQYPAPQAARLANGWTIDQGLAWAKEGFDVTVVRGRIDELRQSLPHRPSAPSDLDVREACMLLQKVSTASCGVHEIGLVRQALALLKKEG